MREPLLWFALIGAILFTAEQFNGPEPIVVNDAVRTQIGNLWETQMGVRPSEKELESLVHNWVREEVFYREALRLGLDNEDTIIRRRLVQKLGFLAQEVDETSITEEDVRAHYDKHIADYTLPVRYSLSQIYFSNLDDYESIAKQLNDGNAWQKLGESSLLPRNLVKKSRREITATLGEEFTGQLNQLTEGQWIGPLTSTFGYHVVRLEALTPETATPLAYIEKQVLTDLLHEQREQSLDDYYQDLLDQYDVDYE